MNIFTQSFMAFMIHLGTFKSLPQTSKAMERNSVIPTINSTALIVNPQEVLLSWSV